MIETSAFPSLESTILHRVAGSVDLAEAERGAADALLLVRKFASASGSLNLVLDMRGKQFVTVQAHRAWSEGFARHPALQECIRAVAIVGDDTPSLWAEQALLETEQVRFFVDLAPAIEWLTQVSASRAQR